MKTISVILFLIFSQSSGEYNKRQDYPTNAVNSVQRILENDELQCIPRLICEQLAGGTPGQLRALKVDTQSLFTLLKYLGIDTNQQGSSPMWTLAQAMTTGITSRGDSYTCYQKFPNCPRDQSRLLYYLNNHRGGFFRGFSRPYYGRSESRIVNKEIPARPLVFQNEFIDNTVTNEDKFVFGNRLPKNFNFEPVSPTDRLPNRLQFPVNELPESFFKNQDFQFFPVD